MATDDERAGSISRRRRGWLRAGAACASLLGGVGPARAQGGPPPDLVAVSVSGTLLASGNGTGNAQIQAAVDIQNAGGPLTGVILFQIVLSQDLVFGAGDVVLNAGSLVAPGTGTLSLFLPGFLLDGAWFLGLRVIPAAGETATGNNFITSVAPFAAGINPAQGQVITAGIAPTLFRIFVQPGVWNVLAATSPSSDWSLAIGSSNAGIPGTASTLAPGACEFVAANCSLGTPYLVNGSIWGDLVRAAGTGAADLQHATTDLLVPGSTASFSWPADRVVHVHDVPVISGGPHVIDVQGPGLRWAWLDPGAGAAWRPRSTAAFEGVAGIPQLRSLTAGRSALVVFREGTLSGPVAGSVRVQPLTGVPSITSMALNASQITLTVTGAGFSPTTPICWNGQPLASSTFLSPSQLASVVPPPGPEQAAIITVADLLQPFAVSNALALVWGPATNRGTITTVPLQAGPGSIGELRIENCAAAAPLTLVLDPGLPPGTPTGAIPVGGDQLLRTWSPALIPLMDGLGLFPGIPWAFPAATDAGGNYSLPFVLPAPGLGIPTTLQAATTDPTHPAGFRLTWALAPVLL